MRSAPRLQRSVPYLWRSVSCPRKSAPCLGRSAPCLRKSASCPLRDLIRSPIPNRLGQLDGPVPRPAAWRRAAGQTSLSVQSLAMSPRSKSLAGLPPKTLMAVRRHQPPVAPLGRRHSLPLDRPLALSLPPDLERSGFGEPARTGSPSWRSCAPQGRPAPPVLFGKPPAGTGSLPPVRFYGRALRPREEWGSEYPAAGPLYPAPQPPANRRPQTAGRCSSGFYPSEPGPQTRPSLCRVCPRTEQRSLSRLPAWGVPPLRAAEEWAVEAIQPLSLARIDSLQRPASTGPVPALHSRRPGEASGQRAAAARRRGGAPGQNVWAPGHRDRASRRKTGAPRHRDAAPGRQSPVPAVRPPAVSRGSPQRHPPPHSSQRCPLRPPDGPALRLSAVPRHAGRYHSGAGRMDSRRPKAPQPQPAMECPQEQRPERTSVPAPAADHKPGG